MFYLHFEILPGIFMIANNYHLNRIDLSTGSVRIDLIILHMVLAQFWVASFIIFIIRKSLIYCRTESKEIK